MANHASRTKNDVARVGCRLDASLVSSGPTGLSSAPSLSHSPIPFPSSQLCIPKALPILSPGLVQRSAFDLAYSTALVTGLCGGIGGGPLPMYNVSGSSVSGPDRLGTITIKLPQSNAGAVLIPESFVTCNNGFEVLGTNWDVYAEESPAPSIDFIEHQSANGTSILRSFMSAAAGTGRVHTRSTLSQPGRSLAAHAPGSGLSVPIQHIPGTETDGSTSPASRVGFHLRPTNHFRAGPIAFFQTDFFGGAIGVGLCLYCVVLQIGTWDGAWIIRWRLTNWLLCERSWRRRRALAFRRWAMALIWWR